MAASSERLEKLDTIPGVWRGLNGRIAREQKNISSKIKELDDAFPGGGWPLGALTEILSRRTGLGELRLLMPALAEISRSGGWIAWIAPPHIPYAPALAAAGIRLSRMLVIRPQRTRDVLWSVEQALRSGSCKAVLGWLESGDERTLRRLQLAAAEGGSWGVIFRPERFARLPSPAALRLVIDRDVPGHTIASLIKCRGGRPVPDIHLDNTISSGPGAWAMHDPRVSFYRIYGL